MATMLADLFTPEVALAYAMQGFYESLEFINNFVDGQDDAIVMHGSPVAIFGGSADDAGTAMQAPKIANVGASMIATRNFNSNNAATPTKFTAVNDNGIKIARRAGPTEFTFDGARLGGLGGPEAFSAAFGIQAGREFALNIQNSIIAAARGFVEGLTASVHTNSQYNTAGSKNLLTPGLLTDTFQLMGDARDWIRWVVCHSNAWNDMYKDAIGRAFMGVGDKAVQGDEAANHMGRRWAKVDATLLRVANGGSYKQYYTLAFGPRCMEVFFTEPLFFYPEFLDTSRETVTIRARGDADLTIKVNGSQWNLGAGGTNPTDAVLATSTNWVPTYTRHKEAQIVELYHNSTSD